MGRYIAIGIPVEIYVHSRGGFNHFDTVSPEIKKNIEKYIDIDYYNVEEVNNAIYYSIKDVNMINNQLPDLLNEVKSICDLKNYFLYCFKNENGIESINIEDNIKKDDYCFELKYFDENYNFEDENKKYKFKNNYGIISKDSIAELDYPYEASYWMIYGNRKVSVREIKIQARYVLLGCDENKFASEDETYLLWVLNTLAKSYFKNKLAKNLHFYVTG